MTRNNRSNSSSSSNGSGSSSGPISLEEGNDAEQTTATLIQNSNFDPIVVIQRDGNVPLPPPLTSVLPIPRSALPNSSISSSSDSGSSASGGLILSGTNNVHHHHHDQKSQINNQREPTYDQIKPVIGIPIPNTNTELTNEIMKGWITKYNYDNVPPEALMEVFKFVDVGTLSNCSLVSKNWYLATLHDALWENSVRKLFESFNNQESNYYVVDCGRMNKKYGTPIKPPPKVKKIEDYVTIENGKIISYHTLRALNIEQGKKKLISKLKRDRKEYWRTMFQEKYDNVSS